MVSGQWFGSLVGRDTTTPNFCAGLCWDLKHVLLKRIGNYFRNVWQLREDPKYYLMRTLYSTKVALIEIGNILVQKGIIESSHDVSLIKILRNNIPSFLREKLFFHSMIFFH
jgi:hypothetical protein